MKVTFNKQMTKPDLPPCPELHRCLCGSLLARCVPGGVELKCRRCKRTVTIPLEKPPRTAG